MILRIVPAALALCCAAAATAQTIEAPPAAQARIDRVAGLYDGGQMEIAALLELGRDGRYRYQLSYGAVDERSAGTWVLENDAVVLISDPFKAPSFEIAAEDAQDGNLAVRMASTNGIDPQYFAVSFVRASGTMGIEHMGAQGITIPRSEDPIVSLTPLLPILDLIGPVFQVPVSGSALRIAFAPNDLGFVGFDNERLNRVTDTYDLVRHGRTLRFRKVDQGE